jgi:hypothetical protein
MSALPPIADMCGAQAYVRFVPKADIREMMLVKKRDRLTVLQARTTFVSAAVWIAVPTSVFNSSAPRSSGP